MDKARLAEINITPSSAQYRQLVHDLKVLREAGAESNTAAIVDAVHEAARRRRLPAPIEERRAA